MPLPPPPRSVRANGPNGLRLAWLILIPFALFGLALSAWLPVLLWVQHYGHPIAATVDRLTTARTGKNRRTTTHIVHFHFDLHGRRWDDQQTVTAAEYAARHVGEPLTGRAVVVAGHPIAVTDVGNLNRATGRLVVVIIVWDGIVGLFLWAAFVAPWRTRRLLRTGTATTGEIVASDRPAAGRMRGYQTRYRFTALGGRTVESTAVTAGRRPPPVPLDPGSPIDVIYDPAKPTRNLAVALAGYRVGEAE